MKAKWCLYIDGCPSLEFFSSQYKRLLTGGHLTVEVGGGLQNQLSLYGLQYYCP